jgi:hypothetical protein
MGLFCMIQNSNGKIFQDEHPKAPIVENLEPQTTAID